MSEYEIYSGNFGSFTQGDELQKKAKLDTDQIQKRMISHILLF
jgi:hypothetical protein